jgi:hypothetical protein
MAEEPPINREQKSQPLSPRRKYDFWDSRLPIGLGWLLIYQWILAIGSLAHASSGMVEGWTDRDSLDWLGVVIILVLVSWGIAMAIASVGIMRQRPRGFLVGMICHLLIEILALPAMLFFGIDGLLGISDSGIAGALAGLFLIFALMCLPFVLISGWGFFYLRMLRKRLFSW